MVFSGRNRWAWLICITLLALFFRTYRLSDLMVFRADQAIDAQAVLNMLRSDFTLLGPKASVGNFYNGPVVYYLMYPFFFLLGEHPLSGTIMQVLLSTLTVPLIYYVGCRVKNDSVGLLAAFLFAISPLHIDYSRAIFNSYPAIFFSSASLCVLLWLAYSPRPQKTPHVIWGSGALGILLGMMMQMHYFTIVIVGTALLLPFFHTPLRTRTYIAPLLLGILVGLSAYILFEITHNFLNIRGILEYVSTGGGTWSPWPIVMAWPMLLAMMVGGNNVWFGVLAFLTVCWTLFAYRKRFTSTAHPAFILLLTILLMALLVFVYGKPLTTHYTISIHATLLILFSWGLHELLQANGKKIVLAAFLLLLINIPAYAWFAKTNPLQDGLSANDLQHAAHIIQKDTAGGSFTIGMDAQQDNRAMPVRYFLSAMDKHPLSIEQYGEADTLYFILPIHKQESAISIWEFTVFGEKKLEQTWKLNEEYVLRKYVHMAP